MAMSESNPSSGYDIVIAGAGITGLVTGYLCNRAGYAVKILETGSEPGGAMKSVRDGDWLAECGPGSILESSHYIPELIEELDPEGERIFANPEAGRRYLVKNGRPVEVPSGLAGLIATPLLSLRSKLAVPGELFRGKGYKEDEALADFVRRRLGPEFLDQFINALVGGIYAGDPEQLSVRYGFPRLQALEDQRGSLLWGQLRGVEKDPKRREIPRNRARVFSFRDGVQVLAHRLAGQLTESISYQHRITGIDQAGGGFEVTADAGGSEAVFTAPKVISAVPAYALANIPLNGDTASWQPLPAITYAPVSVINLGYRKEDVAHPCDGFGVLVPERESYRILGVQFNSAVFPHRAPEGHLMLTVFLGGMRYPELTESDEQKQIAIAKEDLSGLLGVGGDPQFVQFTRWNRAIPQYEVGYRKYAEAIEQLEQNHPGLHVAGNYRGGISLGDCITNAHLLYQKITSGQATR